MLADELDYVVGVDTHRDEHVLAVVAAPAGAVVARRAVAANARGYRRRCGSRSSTPPAGRVWAIEGTGSYGAGLTRYLSGRGETVLEIGRAPRAERRLHGKDDRLDASRSSPGSARERDARAAAQQESDERRCGCCYSLVEAQSMCAAKRSSSYAA